MKLRIPALFACATLALAACNDDGTSSRDLRRGEFRGTVRGEFRADVRGNAESGSSVGFGQDQILLTDTREQALIFAVHLDDEFTEGRRPLADLSDETGVLAGIVIGGRFFIGETGTIDIDDIASAGIRGSLEFTGVEADPETGQILSDEVTVDVVFNTDFDSGCCGFNLVPTQTRVRMQKMTR